MVRWLIGICFMAALAAGGYWLFKHPEVFTQGKEEQKPTPVVKVEVKDILQTLRATGEVTPVTSTEVKSEVSGQIKRVLVTAGERVTRGQKLVVLDRAELESEERENLLAIKTTELRAAKHAKDLNRNEQLWRGGLIAEKDYDDSRTENQLAINELALQQAKLATLRQKLSKTEIFAPHDGIVLNLEAKEGAVIVGASSVSSGTVLMEVVELNHLLVNANINEIDVCKLDMSMPVELSFNSIPDFKGTGTITFISPSPTNYKASSSNNSQRNDSGSGGNTIRTFPVEIAMTESDKRIRPGITANVSIKLAECKQVASVPVSVVFTGKDDKSYVFLKQNGSADFKKTDVVTGINDTQLVEIKEGLKPGDEVASEMPSQAMAEQKEAKKNEDKKKS